MREYLFQFLGGGFNQLVVVYTQIPDFWILYIHSSLKTHTLNIFVPQFVIVLATRGLVAMRTQKEK